ncbi:MAG: hypothetical protein M3N45_02180 [Actinomycetota bacterium]|nr:hypothetical protein [Actinomycetota bacterium]
MIDQDLSILASRWVWEAGDPAFEVCGGEGSLTTRSAWQRRGQEYEFPKATRKWDQQVCGLVQRSTE